MVHSFFMCDFARACWFGSTMALRSDTLCEPVTNTIVSMGEQLTDQQWERFVGSLWGVWRCRNDQTYGGKQASVIDFNRYARAIEREVTVLKAGKSPARNSNNVSSDPLAYDHIMPNDPVCQVDGSWASDWVGGIAFVLTRGIELKAYSSIGIRSCCPMQSEAAALKEAVTFVQSHNISGCKFLSDCKELVDLCQQTSPPLQADWRIFHEVLEVWHQFKSRPDYSCFYVPRSQNTLADFLAKQGRVNRWSLQGYTFPILSDWR